MKRLKRFFNIMEDKIVRMHKPSIFQNCILLFEWRNKRKFYSFVTVTTIFCAPSKTHSRTQCERCSRRNQDTVSSLKLSLRYTWVFIRVEMNSQSWFDIIFSHCITQGMQQYTQHRRVCYMSYLISSFSRTLKSRANLWNVSRPLPVKVVKGEWRYTVGSRSRIDTTHYASRNENIVFPLQQLSYSRFRTSSFIRTGLTADSFPSNKRKIQTWW